MNKKRYITPAIEQVELSEELMLNEASIAEIGGNAGIAIGDPNDDVPTSGDSKGHTSSIWDWDE